MATKKKQPNRKPTMRQKKAFDKVVENGGNASKAMREVGYSVETAKTPSKLTQSDGWLKLMEEHLPDSLLAKVHEEGLKAMRGEDPDNAVRHKYLDTAYKLKGSYAPEKKQTLHANINVDLKTQEISEKYEDELRQQLLE